MLQSQLQWETSQKMFRISGEGLESYLFIFFLTTVFTGYPCLVAGLEFFPICQRCSYWWLCLPLLSSEILESAAAQIFGIRKIQTLRSPSLKKIKDLKGSNSQAWEEVWLPGGADLWAKGQLPRLGRKRWPPLLPRLTRAGHNRGAHPGTPLAKGWWGKAAPGHHTTLPRLPIVFRGAEQWSTDRSDPRSPTHGYTRRPEAGFHSPAPRRVSSLTPAPPANSEISPPWLHN